MKRVLVFIAILVFAAGSANAAKNAGGALIVHTNNEPLLCTLFLDWCGELYSDPGTCEDAQNMVLQPGLDVGVWLIAAFDTTMTPGVSEITFGIESSGVIFQSWGPCVGDENPGPSWPTATFVGNRITFTPAIVGSHLFPFYFFCVTGAYGSRIETTINPAVGYAGFYSDDQPPVLDEVERFGHLKWFEPGFNECPGTEGLGACCFYNGTCQVITEAGCQDIGGEFKGDLSDCDPNPCTVFGACCFTDGTCITTWTERDCFALYPEDTCTWMPGEDSCDPDPCPHDRCPVGCCLLNPLQTCERVNDDEECKETFNGVIVGFVCNFNPCPPVGACCLVGGNLCEVHYEGRCMEIGGARWIINKECDPNPCTVVDVQEPATELTSWGKIKTGYR